MRLGFEVRQDGGGDGPRGGGEGRGRRGGEVVRRSGEGNAPGRGMGRSTGNPSMSMEGAGAERWRPARRTGGAMACMVNVEVSAVLAVMRRNARWAGRYMASDDQMEHPLIRSLKSLRRRVFSWQQQSWRSINPSFYLSPFLDVIRSDETGAQITGIALSAVYKIVTLEVFNVQTAHVDAAMHMIVDAVTSCRFEVTDPASEEVVLMKILQVM